MGRSDAQKRRQLGWWRAGQQSPDSSQDALQRAARQVDEPFSLVEAEGRLAVARQGTWGLGGGRRGDYPLLAQVPALHPRSLGAPSFLADYQVDYAYVVGAMANGISSVDLVTAAAEGGLLGVFGAAGLSIDEVATAITTLKERLGSKSFGVNFIHSPQEPELESALVDLLIKESIQIVSASAFMGLTPALVRYRAKGLSRDGQGRVVIGHRILAKVSRQEVAKQFLRPAPEKILKQLLDAGKITAQQAELAAQVPMADDLTAEADSGGHTDHRALVVLLPALLALRDQIQAEQGYAQAPRVGAAGGIATPSSAAAAFSLGADYILTGSVNQACLESGSSDRVRQMLAVAKSTDVTRAPAADMFEMGVTVQVLAKGTLFAQRAKRLDALYRRYASLGELPADERKKVEEILGQTIEAAWASCERFFEQRDPGQLERAAKDPKHQMALVFRAYLGLSSRWANAGDPARAMDYQIWCGPSMGAFNDWVEGSWLEEWSSRRVLPIAHNILIGAAAELRLSTLRAQGILVPRVGDLPPLAAETAAQLLERSVVELPAPEGAVSLETKGGQESVEREAVAIVGMGALFPQAADLDGYWKALRQGVDAIGEVPDSHWSLEDYYDEDPQAPDMTYGRRGGFLDPVDFDPTEFGIPPTIMEATDTSQLLALMVARQALDDAGYGDGVAWDRSRASVVLGVTGTQELVINLGARLGHPRWRRALEEAGVDAETTEDVVARIAQSYVSWQESSFPGLLGNVVAGRIANRLDFGGTNCVVDAACASSFGALHMALMELETGRADMVLSGGVDALNDIFMHMCFSKTPALSATGDCRPFSAAGDGTVLGEGVGMVVLKRLSDAERDGDRVYAVLRSVGTSSDGRAKSIYAPVASGQARALRSAYEQAGTPPHTIAMLEAHGTGTKAGDVAEFTALNEVYRASQAEGTWCAIGSVKSQIGHTKAAAGAAGLIKAALALRHKVLLPTLKASDQPNPKLGIEGSPFYLSDRARPWLPHDEHPRRAAISSFGFGGSDFHAVLEEYRPQRPEVAWDGSVNLLALSADSLPELQKRLQDLVIKPELVSEFDSNDRHRVILVLTPDEDLKDRVQEVLGALADGPAHWSSPRGSYYAHGAAEPMAFVFPGQGAQRVDMLLELACMFPEFMDRLATLGPLAERIYPIPAQDEAGRQSQQEALTRTDVAQPALGAIGSACHSLMGRFGLHAQHFAGHSYGELVALHAAGVLSTEDLFKASRRRGELMAGDGEDRGTMLVVLAPLEEIKALIESQALDVVLANENAPSQGVIAGSREAIDAAEKACKAAKLRTRRISVAAAFHSPLVATAEAEFTASLEQVDFGRPIAPVYANTSAQAYGDDPIANVRLLGGQLSRPVRWKDSVETMWDQGARVFVELGPGKTLSGMITRTLGDRDHHCVALDDGGARGALFGLAKLLARLAALGHPVRLGAWQQRALAPRAEQIKPRKPKMSMPITGANYRAPYEPMAPRSTAPVVVAPSATPSTAPVVTQTPVAVASPDATLLHQSLQQLQALQAQTAQLHGQFLEGQRQAQLGIQNLLSGVAAPHPVGTMTMAPGAPSVPAAMPPVPVVASVQPAAVVSASVDEVRSATPPAVKASVQQAAAVSREDLASALCAVTADATGYPVEMLKLEMEFEADLGVDSIKRVEILSRLADRIPGAPQVNPEDLSDLRSLAQVIDFMGAKIQAAPSLAVASSPSPVTAAPIAASTLTPAKVQAAVFAVIAQTTGYPESMLEASMEFEADLGVDSIKRVEILSRVADDLPELPQVNPEDLSDLRSIAQVVDFLCADLGRASTTAAVSSAPAATLNAATVQSAVFSVIAQTTGYPESMLEASMEFEADLGVDSIKRVEILSRVADDLPELPQVNPEDLSDLRSIAQVVDFLCADLGRASTTAAVSGAPAATLSAATVQSAVFSVIAQTTGYPESMLEASMEFEADLGVDSIKRVEILSRVADELPELPQVNPEDLSDLRSIAQVVSFLVADLGDEAQPSVVVEASAPAVDDGVRETVVTGALACRAVQPRLIQGPDPSDVPAFHCLPDHEIWIYDNGTSFAQALVFAFEARGVAARVIDDKGEGNCKPCGGLVLLAGSNESNHPLWSAATEEQLKRSVMLVKNLAPALRSAQAAGGALLCSVTQLDGRLGTGQTDHLVDPLQAGLAGLVKTAAKEWSGLHGRVIDVAPQWGDTTSAEAVVDACLKSGPVELGLGPDGEVTLDVLTQPEPRPRRALEAGSLFIITGGARGVTAACAIELASRQPGLAFALWGRSRLEPEPEDLEGVEDEASLKRLLLERSGAVQTPKELQAACARILAQREIRATLAAIEAVGAKAVYASVDLRDKDAVSTEVTQLEARFGPVRGIVHGAGVLRDRRIEDKTRDQLDDVLDTKLAGLRHLLGTLRLEELRSLNLFASITGRVGRVGQVDYAVANQALDKVAWQLAAQLPACRVQSFAWGPWDGGMVTPALRQTFVNEGVGLIPLQAGARCFADWALAAPGAYAELLVGVDLPELAAADALGGKDGRALRHVDLHPELPVLTHHRLAGEGVLPMALGVDWMVQESRRLGLGLQLNRVENAQVLQGVSVSEPLTLSVCLESSRVEGNDLRQTMSLRDSTGRQRMRAEVVLSSEAPLLQSTSMEALPASGGYSSEAIYGEALFHGPLLQAIESVDGLNSDGIDVSLVRPEAAGPWLQDEGADWDPEGALWLDSAFQAMILWSRDQQSAPSLPSRFGRWQRFQEWPEVAPRLRARVRSVKGAMITSDICFLGPDDEVVALVEDYAATASPQLADAFEDHGNEPAPKG